MSRILVTGSAGLIGSVVAKKLTERGHEVIDCDIRFIKNPLSFYSDKIKSIDRKSVG